MELLYLYIGGRQKIEIQEFRHLEDSPYKVLKNVELNFSNRFNISFNKEEKKLELKDNDEYIPGFFDDTGKIKSITGIIGKNGTGKSSIIDLILTLQKGNFHNQIYKIIAVFFNEKIEDTKEKPELTFKVYYHPELDFYPYTEVSDYKPFFKEDSKVSIKDIYLYDDNIPSYKMIYYSPIFEIKKSSIKNEYEVLGESTFENISTIALLETDAGNQINASINNMDSANVIKRHNFLEIERQLQLLVEVENVKDLLGFEIPNIIELSIDDMNERFVKFHNEKNFEHLYYSLENYPKSKKLTPKQWFLFNLHRAALFYILRFYIGNPLP